MKRWCNTLNEKAILSHFVSIYVDSFLIIIKKIFIVDINFQCLIILAIISFTLFQNEKKNVSLLIYTCIAVFTFDFTSRYSTTLQLDFDQGIFKTAKA